MLMADRAEFSMRCLADNCVPPAGRVRRATGGLNLQKVKMRTDPSSNCRKSCSPRALHRTLAALSWSHSDSRRSCSRPAPQCLV